MSATNSTASTPPLASSSISSEPSPSSSIASSVPSSIVSPPSTPSPSPSPPSPSPPPPEPPAASSPPVNTVTAAPPPPTVISVSTSIVTQPPPSNGQPTSAPVTVVVTISNPSPGTPTALPTSTKSSSSTSTTSTGAALQNNNKGAAAPGGLSPGGRTAIAVVIPVVVVALLVLAGLFLWRRRKQRQAGEEQRRKEMEEYGFNPNNDPTLPSVGLADGSEMAEDQSGYRGWGNAASAGAATTRKTSTTVSGGPPAYSDTGSQPGGYHSPGSPTEATVSENSGDPLVGQRRRTMDSETIGALGSGPVANQNNRGDILRGPSNASSRYSAGAQSEHSSEPPIPMSNPQEYYENAYYQPGPYSNGYGRGVDQPVIKDVSARRNTRIENPTVVPQQGNMGIAQNF